MLSGLPTPFLVVDARLLDDNLAAMARWSTASRVALRPHAKTHKCREIAQRQLRSGAVGLTVATLGEAEVFAAAGVEDLFVAYPLWVDGGQGRRLRALLDRAVLTVGVDSAESARALAAQSGGPSRLRVLVEVDSGQHRSGVRPAEAGDVATVAAHCGLDVRGVFTFPGHGYDPAGRDAAAGDEARALDVAADALRAVGVEPAVRSGGSTPTMQYAEESVLTEARPGVYAFGDAQQWQLGSTAADRIALWCLATVVSRAGGRVVLDAGSKVLAADRPAWAKGYGRLLDHPEARIGQLSEHHAVVDWPSGQPAPGVGERLRVVPNHVCAAVNLVDTLTVVDDGRVVDHWAVAARGRNH